MLSPGPATEHLTLASSSVSDGSCSGLDLCVGIYVCTVKIVRGIPVVTSILRPLARTSISSSLASTPDTDSSDDYLEIGASVCGEPAEGGHLICMVALNGDRSHNRFSRYPTIRRSKASDAQTPSDGLVRNMNPDFNAVQVQTIMETIQRIMSDGSPLAVLAQQGAEATNLVVTEKSIDVSQREPLVGNNDRVRCARSEAMSLASPNHRLSKRDA
jgi:hypothetical protein